MRGRRVKFLRKEWKEDPGIDPITKRPNTFRRYKLLMKRLASNGVRWVIPMSEKKAKAMASE